MLLPIKAWLWNYRDRLNLDQVLRSRQMAHLDECNGGITFFEKFFSEFVELRNIAKIGHEDGHGDDIIESAACFRERIFDLIEGRFKLRFEVPEISVRRGLARRVPGKKEQSPAFNLNGRGTGILF